MKKLMFFFLMLIAATVAGWALEPEVPDSCLKYFNRPYDSTFSNRDSVMVDSCENSPSYCRFFGKKFFMIEFNYNIIPRNYIAPLDTIIEYTIDSINSSYTTAITW